MTRRGFLVLLLASPALADEARKPKTPKPVPPPVPPPKKPDKPRQGDVMTLPSPRR